MKPYNAKDPQRKLRAFYVYRRSMRDSTSAWYPDRLVCSRREHAMADKVKCANCGFLAMRNIASRALLDAEQATRIDGSLTGMGNNFIYEEYPVCFVLALDFIKEIGPSPGRDSRHPVIQQDRDCKKFTKWHQGFTPKEHKEMIDSERQKTREDDRDQANRDFLANQAALNKRHNLRMFTVAVIGIAVAVAGTLLKRPDPAPVVNVTNPPIQVIAPPADSGLITIPPASSPIVR